MLFKVLKDLIASRARPLEADVLRHARDFLGTSRPEEALAILNALLEYRPDCVDGLILRGTAKRSAGRAQEALADLVRATDLAPDNPLALSELGQAWYILGEGERALECSARARRLAPEMVEPFEIITRIKLSGEFYFDVIRRVFSCLNPQTYVEIGVFQGDSLRLAKPPTLAIGIDPDPKLREPPAANHRIFAETSDAFFAQRDLKALLGGLPVDLAFIDGMHHFDFALRDFSNLERFCTPDSTILLHDCYPLDRESASRDWVAGPWSGDVWRLIVLLKKYRPDLAIHTIGTAPTGLGLVRRLDPSSRTLMANYEQVREEFLGLDFSYLDEGMAEKLNLFPNDWESVSALLTRG